MYTVTLPRSWPRRAGPAICAVVGNAKPAETNMIANNLKAGLILRRRDDPWEPYESLSTDPDGAILPHDDSRRAQCCQVHQKTAVNGWKPVTRQIAETASGSLRDDEWNEDDARRLLRLGCFLGLADVLRRVCLAKIELFVTMVMVQIVAAVLVRRIDVCGSESVTWV